MFVIIETRKAVIQVSVYMTPYACTKLPKNDINIDISLKILRLVRGICEQTYIIRPYILGYLENNILQPYNARQRDATTLLKYVLAKIDVHV